MTKSRKFLHTRKKKKHLGNLGFPQNLKYTIHTRIGFKPQRLKLILKPSSQITISQCNLWQQQANTQQFHKGREWRTKS